MEQPKVGNVNATVDHKTIVLWTEDWLKWALHSPASTPPLTSPDNAEVNNNGSIFFLAGGNWGNNGSIPTIHVPVGKPVLLPMVNAWDIEGPGIETIPGFVASGRGSFADEAKLVTDLAQKAISDAHLTVTSVGDSKVLIDTFSLDTGTFTLGAPHTNPPDVIGQGLIDAGVNLSPLDALPFTEEVGRWAMIDGLAPGDYKVNFGGTIAPVKDPVTGTPIFGDFSDPTNPKPVIVNTTDILHVA